MSQMRTKFGSLICHFEPRCDAIKSMSEEKRERNVHDQKTEEQNEELGPV